MNGNGVWKWLAAFLAGAMLAGAPTYTTLLSKPTTRQLEGVRLEIRSLQLQQVKLSERILVLQQQIRSLLAQRRI